MAGSQPLEAVGGALTREVGGLPVVAWGLIAGGGLLLGRRILGGGGLGGGGGTATPFVDPNSTGYTATGEPASGGYGAVSSPTSITSNDQWRRAAVDYLISVGVQGTTAEAAVGRYLAGKATAADLAVVDTAIRRIGSPPDAPVIPDPSPSVPGTPRPVRSTTVMAPFGLGENLDQVAARIRNVMGVKTTPDGRPLTASYLASTNGLNVRTTTALRAGTRILY